MVELALVVMAVFAVLCVSEWGWRKRWLQNELGRKFVHITVGSFVAFWPFFITWGQVRFVSLAFLAVVTVSAKLNLFHAIHSVQRPTYGEACFALSVGLLACITQSKGIYAVAILHMSLADGLAAIVGTRYGKGNSYRVFGHPKSIVGTLAFAATSLAILVGYSTWLAVGLPIALLASIPILAAAVENIAPCGLDNLFVPVGIGLLLAAV